MEEKIDETNSKFDTAISKIEDMQKQHDSLRSDISVMKEGIEKIMQKLENTN
jgi:uncharacterized coiled-coil DUF342 family protein